MSDVTRRFVLRRGAVLASAGAFLRPARMLAQVGAATVLQVASAGSMRAMLEGPLKQAAAKELGLELRTHAGGADAVARSLVDGSVAADVFVPITAGPIRTVLQAGLAAEASPFAATEMVLLYSPKSPRAAAFAEAAQGKRPWWTVLREPGLRFARSNPADDPSGRAIWFAMMLASRKYGQPNLVQEVLGTPLNPEQVRPGVDVRGGLENGTIDAAGSYRIATRLGSIPFVPLPAEVNLSDPQVGARHPELVLSVAERTFRVEPLVFYAAALKMAKNAEGAARFVLGCRVSAWLRCCMRRALRRRGRKPH